jgi:hypothetical protein
MSKSQQIKEEITDDYQSLVHRVPSLFPINIPDEEQAFWELYTGDTIISVLGEYIEVIDEFGETKTISVYSLPIEDVEMIIGLVELEIESKRIN